MELGSSVNWLFSKCKTSKFSSNSKLFGNSFKFWLLRSNSQTDVTWSSLNACFKDSYFLQCTWAKIELVKTKQKNTKKKNEENLNIRRKYRNLLLKYQDMSRILSDRKR